MKGVSAGMPRGIGLGRSSSSCGIPLTGPRFRFVLLLPCGNRYVRDMVRSAGFAKAREGRHPHRIAGDEPISPRILWGCRACGAQRRVPGNSPAALERACGRWGPKGMRRGALPLAAEAALAPAALGAREAVR